MSGHKTNVSLSVSLVETIFRPFSFPFSSMDLKAKRLGLLFPPVLNNNQFGYFSVLLPRPLYTEGLPE